MSKRREFIKSGALVAAGSLILPAACTTGKKDNKEEKVDSTPPSKMEAGIQVYSVRNQLREDFQGTMTTIAEIGYKLIEGYGLGLDGMFLGNISPEYYRKIIADLGMKLVATHCSYFNHDDASKMIEAAKKAGIEYLIIPSIPGEKRENIDAYKAAADNFNKIGEQCINAGIKFGYHNHAFEFEKIEDQIPQEVLITGTQADLVAFEADLFWATKGGYDPVELINKFPGRIKLVHVKDATSDLGEATVGEGVIDFKSIFEAGKKSGLEYYFIEDEREDDPFLNIKNDYDYIVAQEFV